MTKERIFSGSQPSGKLTLGNYLGALRQWSELQHKASSLFCIVDLHAITSPQDPVTLRNNIHEVAISYIACGIDPEKSIIFQQSHVKNHTQLAWIFSCMTPLGWLNRMTQFKEKAGKERAEASLGLYAYPILQAADILLYKATHVPVGEDQRQHLELSRDIAGVFNRYCGHEIFTLPQALIVKESARVMSLRDGKKKMSKSDKAEASCVYLNDNPDEIMHKIRKAKTDLYQGISYDPLLRPEISNLVDIFCGVTRESRESLVQRYENSEFSYFKQELADALISHLAPIRENIIALKKDTSYIKNLLKVNAEKAQILADATLLEVESLIGFS